jgi:2-polyprenyl-3-methyl-5-hydroxy-6-metoxy-1,4-benzoquinol methylase
MESVQYLWDRYHLEVDERKGTGLDKEIKSFAKLCRSFKLKNILDLGCGRGYYDFILNKLGFNVLGVDASKIAIEYAKQNAKRLKTLKFKVQDVRKYNFDKRKWDAVVMAYLYSHLTKTERIKLIERINKFLSAGGFIFLFNSLSFGESNKNVNAREGFKHFFTREEINKELKDFKKIRFYTDRNHHFLFIGRKI